MNRTEQEDKVFDKLVNSGASELYAGFVARFPESLISKNFMNDMGHGHFETYLWEGNIVRAMQRADLENHRRLIILFSEDNWRKSFCTLIPAYLEKKKEE